MLTGWNDQRQLKQLEADLWSAADNLRANSDLKSSEYAIPVLGLIFLRFTELLSSPLCKNIPLPALPKSLLYPPPSRPMEGRIAIVTDAGRDAVDAAASGDVRGWQGGSTRPVS